MSYGWSVQGAIDAIEDENPPELGPEPKSEFVVVSVGTCNQQCWCEGTSIRNPHTVQSHGREPEYPQWDEEVARNAEAILADYGG